MFLLLLLYIILSYQYHVKNLEIQNTPNPGLWDSKESFFSKNSILIQTIQFNISMQFSSI